jgi:hypothetical protein
VTQNSEATKEHNMPSSPNRTRSKVSRKPRPGCASLTDDQVAIGWAVNKLRMMEKEMKLLKQVLNGVLPDRDPTTSPPIYLINPKTGKKERVG